MRQEIREKLNLELVNVEVLIEDLKRKNFTGYVKITTWEGEDYIPFYEGNIQKVFIVTRNGIEETTYSNYGYPQTGVIEIVETDAVSLMNALRKDFSPETEGPLCIAGYGEEFQPPSPASHIDIEHFNKLASESNYNGYLLFFTHKEPVGMVLYYNGLPVGVFAPQRSGERAINYIRLGLKNSHIAMLLLEPDLIPLMLAMTKLEVLKSGRIEGKNELEAIKDDISTRRMNALLYIDRGRADRHYLFFYKGQEVKGLHQTLFSIREEEGVDITGEYKLFPLYVDTSPKSLELRFDLEDEVIDRIPVDRVKEIREAFIDEIGPVGNLLWKKILNEFGWREEAIPSSRSDSLLDRLAEEIPYEEHRENFLKKVRRLG
jgi:hypothetical protein